MRVLFALNHLGFYRNFERTIHELRASGCDVKLVVSKEHKSVGADDFGMSDFLHVNLKSTREYRDYKVIQSRRIQRDILFYAGSRFDGAKHLKDRFVSQQKGMIDEAEFRRQLHSLSRYPPWVHGLMDRRHQMVENATPPHPNAVQAIEAFGPDLVVGSPVVNFFSQEMEYFKAARQRGIPTVLPVASWDNLTNKGRLKVMPDTVAVWNEAMAEEAVNLHTVPRRRIIITGAPVFDWWFNQDTRWSRREFLIHAGFDTISDARIFVYLCSSASIGGGKERQVVSDWAAAIRGADDPEVQTAYLIVRPHPMATGVWEDRSSSDFAIFPRNVTHPTSDVQRAFFYNTIYHADAIVGLNTSAMIEAAILGKPVLTFRGHASEVSQSGNLHFRHLTDSGCVRVASNLSTHLSQLSDVIARPDMITKAARAFVKRFVRPLGLERSASTELAGAILAKARLARRVR